MTKEQDQRINAECRETERLKRRAWRLGVPVPTDSNCWNDDTDELMEHGGVDLQTLELIGRSWLGEEGKARLTFLIEEAEIKKESAELDRHLKRVTIRSQTISIIFGVGGLLIGLLGVLVALLRNK